MVFVLENISKTPIGIGFDIAFGLGKKLQLPVLINKPVVIKGRGGAGIASHGFLHFLAGGGVVKFNDSALVSGHGNLGGQVQGVIFS